MVTVGTTSQLTAAYGGALEVNVRVRQPTEAEVASAAQKLGLASLDALLDPEALARLAVRPRPSFRVPGTRLVRPYIKHHLMVRPLYCGSTMERSGMGCSS